MLDDIRALPGVSLGEHDPERVRAGLLVSDPGSHQGPAGAGRPAAHGAIPPRQLRLLQDDADSDAWRTRVHERRRRRTPAGRGGQQAFCRHGCCPGIDPIGQILLRNVPNPPPVTIVGVVDDVFDVSVTQSPEPTLYLPWAQNNNFGVPIAFVIRTSVDAASLLPDVREVIRRVDPSLPLRRAQPLEVFVQESTAPERFRTHGARHHRPARPGAGGRRHFRRDLSRRGRSQQGIRRAAGARIATGGCRPPGVVRIDARPGDRRHRRSCRRRRVVRVAGTVAGECRRGQRDHDRRCHRGHRRRSDSPRPSCRRCASCACTRPRCYEANG